MVETRALVGPLRFVLAAGVLAAGVVAYVVFGTTTQVDGSRMARLVVSSTGIAQFEHHPSETAFEPPSKSSLALVKRAGESRPTETGSYQVTWRTKASKTNEASLLVQLLPTATLASSLQRTLIDDYSEKKRLTAESLELAQRFTVATLPGAFAASYTEKGSTSSSTTSTAIYVVLFHVNRVVMFVLMQSSSTSIGERDASSLAQDEAQHLGHTEPSFSLVATIRPAWRGLWFGLGTLTVAALMLLLPRILRFRAERRERKEVRNRLRAQRHVSSRGSKVMQRQRAPAGPQRRPVARRGR